MEVRYYVVEKIELSTAEGPIHKLVLRGYREDHDHPGRFALLVTPEMFLQAQVGQPANISLSLLDGEPIPPNRFERMSFDAV